VHTHHGGHGGGEERTHTADDHGPLPSVTPSRRKERRSLILTFFVTGTILIAEVIGGILTGSLALLADAGHMLTDLSALGISLLAIRFATRPPNLRKTYGYYRVEVLGALLNGVILIGLSTVLFMEAWERFANPPEIKTLPMVLVATIGLVANLVGLWILSGARSNLNVRGAFLHILGDTISSLGVIVGGIVMWATGIYLIDPILTIVIGIVIIASAYSLVREAIDVLLESVPKHLEVETIAHAMEEVEGVEAVHDLHIWTITSGMLALSAHIVVAARMHTGHTDELLTRVKRLLLEAHGINHTTLQIESQAYEHVGPVH
jgi:cobalt-zinc-cadmium efflux system protein